MYCGVLQTAQNRDRVMTRTRQKSQASVARNKSIWMHHLLRRLSHRSHPSPLRPVHTAFTLPTPISYNRLNHPRNRVCRQNHTSSEVNTVNSTSKNEMATAETLAAEIEEQTKLFNKLRLENAEQAAMEDVRKRLGELKKALGQLNAQAGGSGKKKERLLLKTPKVRPIFPSRLHFTGYHTYTDTDDICVLRAVLCHVSFH